MTMRLANRLCDKEMKNERKICGIGTMRRAGKNKPASFDEDAG